MSQRRRSLSPDGASASAPQKPKNGKRKSNDDDDMRSILVSNIPPTLADDKVMIHFQRSSSGGGDVRQVRRLSPSQVKVIFEDVEVIDKVVARKHELDGVTLQVEAWSCFLVRALEVDRASHRGCVQRATVQIHQPVTRPVWDSYKQKMLKTNVTLSRSTRNDLVTLKGSWSDVVQASNDLIALAHKTEVAKSSCVHPNKQESRNGQNQNEEVVTDNLERFHNATCTTPADDSKHHLQAAANNGIENTYDEDQPFDRVDLDRKQGEGASNTTPYEEKEQKSTSGVRSHRSSSEMTKNTQKCDDDTVGFTRSQSLEPMEEDGLNEAMEYATLGSFRQSMSAPGNASSEYGTSSIGAVGPQSDDTYHSPASLDLMELNSSKSSSRSKNQGMAGSGDAISIPGTHKTKSSDPRMALGSEPMDQSGPPRDRTNTSSTYKLPEISAEEKDDEEAETIVDQTVDPDIMSYIINVHSPKINMMARKHGVHFDHSKDNSTVYIKGSKRNAKAASEDFITLYQGLFSKLKCRSLDTCLHNIKADECLDAVKLAQDSDPSVFIKTVDGVITFIGEEQEIRAARATICSLLDITEARRRRRNPSGNVSSSTAVTGPSNAQPSWFDLSTGSSSVFCEKTTGVHVSLIKGDITTQKVDIIVNAANSSLSLVVGVSGAISRAGGRAIQTECDNYIIKHGSLRTTDCVWTTPGRLPCKCIIHAVGPNFVPGCESRCKQELYDTCQKVLNIAASRLNAKSIAMPAISSGASGMPRRLCAEAMCSAIMDFVENGQGIGSSLLDIRIVDYDREAVKAFCDVFKAKIAKNSTSGATGYSTGGAAGYTSSGTGHTTSRIGYSNSGTGYTTSETGYTSSGTGYTASGTGYNSIGPGYTTSGAAGYTTSVTGYSTSLNMTAKYPPSSPNYGSTSHIASSSITYPGPTQTFVTARSSFNPTTPTYSHPTPSHSSSGGLSHTYPGTSWTPQPSQSHSHLGQTHLTTSQNVSPGVASSTSSASGNSDKEDTCPICLCDFTGPVTTTRCKHKFCSDCLDSALKVSGQCPVCKAVIGRLKGNQPQGTMTHRTDYLNPALPGYEYCRATIEIHYYFPDGVQGPEHPNPGKRYTGTSRTAYLPDNVDGREVLRLLKRAFDSRLVFTIGTSATTGLTDTVVWNDIHHKTRKDGGPNRYGYPDPQYLTRVKEELAAKGIK